MCRSKKDGKKGGGHRMGTRSKWHEARIIRAARSARRRQREFAFEEYEQAAEDAEYEVQEDFSVYMEEMYQDFEDYQNRQFDWKDSFDDCDYEYGYMEGRYDSEYGWESDAYPFAGDDYPTMDPPTEVFQAIDRAVRRHGVVVVRAMAHVLAAALDVPKHEVTRCIDLTREGYINR
jgi:hypothetical protein